MAATANSIYQALRLQHVAGIPPETDPQRSTETFTSYQLRMNCCGLQPDIGSDESDSDYLTRLTAYKPIVPLVNESASYSLAGTNAISASYTTKAVNGAKAWVYMTMNSALTSQSFGCNIVRLATGSYGVTFTSATPNTMYAVGFDGFNGLITSPTASMGYAIKQTTNGFTMSISNADAPLVPKDFSTGSLVVFSN